MATTFTKLLSSITASTIWCQPDTTRIAWIAMLAMADKNGVVTGSLPGVASIARIPLEAMLVAIDHFLAPDPYSSTPDYEGRRIVAVPGGWRLLNYERVRAMRDAETVKESKRKYINKRRADEKKGVSQPPSAEEPRNGALANTDKFDTFWAKYPNKSAKATALKAFTAIKPSEALFSTITAALERQSKSLDWTKNNGQFVPHAATWLRGKRWEDAAGAAKANDPYGDGWPVTPAG
jgi:hypothetical protein